jgi:hypothetical protein
MNSAARSNTRTRRSGILLDMGFREPFGLQNRFRLVITHLSLIGWYLLIPPVFSPMGEHHRSFNDLTAPLNKWDIWAKFDSQTSCEKEKEHLRTEAPVRLKFAREHPDQDPNGNIVAVSEAWQQSGCMASDDPRLKSK